MRLMLLAMLALLTDKAFNAAFQIVVLHIFHIVAHTHNEETFSLRKRAGQSIKKQRLKRPVVEPILWRVGIRVCRNLARSNVHRASP